MQKEHNLTDAEVLRNSIDYPWMFGILVDRYQKAFLRKGRSIVHSGDEAEDAVQETFIKIYKNAEKFVEQKEASFKSWAYKILVNTCYTYLERKKIEAERVTSFDLRDLDLIGSSDEFANDERVSFVQSVLSRLPEHMSRLIDLYFFQGKSYAEIAVVEAIPLSSVRSGLHRAKKQFKNIAIRMIQ